MDAFTKIESSSTALSSWCADQKSLLVVCGSCHRILPAKQCVRCRIQTIGKHECDRQQCKIQ